MHPPCVQVQGALPSPPFPPHPTHYAPWPCFPVKFTGIATKQNTYCERFTICNSSDHRTKKKSEHSNFPIFQMFKISKHSNLPSFRRIPQNIVGAVDFIKTSATQEELPKYPQSEMYQNALGKEALPSEHLGFSTRQKITNQG